MRKPYDLMLMLDPEAPEARHAEILSETEAMIAAGGEVTTKQDWGRRRMTFEIDHRPEAAYHLIQFEGEPPVLERLQSSLRIADGVLRFRIIKIKPGTPPPTAPRPEARSAEQDEPEGKVAARAAADAPDPAEEAAPADEAAPSEEAAEPAAEEARAAEAPPAAEAPADGDTPAAAPEGDSA